MRILALAALLTIPAAAAAPTAARADVAADARSATAACLSAVIDAAPVGDIEDGPIAIRRGKAPVSCTVTVSDGEPVIVRDAVLTAITRRSELFRPSKTSWSPEKFATREAFCNLSLRRNLTAVVSTGRPGLRPIAVVTVFEAAERDRRCDQDAGVQAVAAEGQPATPAAAGSDIKEIAAQPVKPKKKSLLRRIPGLSKKD